MYDFPTSPPVGTVVTLPNGTQRLWDGVKWSATAPEGPVEEAPTDGSVYGRRGSTASWLKTLPLTVNTVTVLTVTGNAITVPAGTSYIVVQDAANAVNALTVGTGTLPDGYELWMNFPNGGTFSGVPLGPKGNLTLKVLGGGWSILSRFGCAILTALALAGTADAQPINPPPAVATGGVYYGTSSNTSAGNTAYNAAATNGTAGNSLNVAFGNAALAATTSTGRNTALGYRALTASTIGVDDTALGASALASYTGSASGANVAIGSGAMSGDATTPSPNTSNTNVAVGFNAGQEITTGFQNAFVGAAAGVNVKTGNGNAVLGGSALSGCSVCFAGSLGANASSFNVVIGNQAAMNYAGNNLVAIGYQAAMNLTANGTFTTAIGLQALKASTGADTRNTAVGYSALTALNGANDNTAIGHGSLTGDVTGSQNTAVGAYSLLSTTTSSQTAVGYQALRVSVAGTQNTAIGWNVLKASANAADTNNTGLGWQVFTVLNNGNNNTGLGSSVGSKVTTGSNNTLIGSLVASTTLTTGARNVLIGTAANCDTAASGTTDAFAICASTGATPLISGSLVSTGGALRLNGTGGDTFIGSATALGATATAGFFHFPAQTAAPTATPTSTAVACAWNTATHVLNCYDGASWYKLAGVAGAG